MESNPRKLLDEFIPEAMGKQFVIPIYQRKYTWTVKKQLMQLISDLIILIKDETKQKQHFLGTIVYIENITDEVIEKSIVDGQQRLVTMFLIANAMKTLAEDEYREREIDETYLQNYAQPIGTRYRQRLYPSVTDGDDYLLIAEGRYDEIDSNNKSNIIQNFLYLKHELKGLIDIYGYNRVLYAIKRFSIVYIKLDERDNAQQIFESINSIGERLTASDLIRNFIMMNKSNEEQTNLYNNYWRKLEDVFDNSKDMEDFFRYYLSAVSYEYYLKHVLYQAFKDYYNLEKENNTDAQLLEKLVRYAYYFNNLYYKKPEGKYIKILTDFQNIESMMPAPLVLGIYDLYDQKKVINEEQFYKIIEIINIYLIRRYFNNDDTSRITKSFPYFLRSIIKIANKNGYENIIDIVTYVLVTKNQSNNMALPTDKALINKLLHTNAYSLRMTRWLLEKIENHNNSASLDMNKLSIEHIMPQTITPYWENAAGVTGEEYTQLVNTLGNLTLVSKIDNSKAGNKDFETKKKILRDTLHIHMNKEIDALSEWNSQTINNRSKKLINVLIDMYPYLRSNSNYEHTNNNEVFITTYGINATGYLNDDNTLTIYAGSQINPNVDDFSIDNITKLRNELVDNGIIARTLGGLEFVQNYTASSVSNAASLLLGGARNGWEYWRDSDGIIINDSLRKK